MEEEERRRMRRKRRGTMMRKINRCDSKYQTKRIIRHDCQYQDRRNFHSGGVQFCMGNMETCVSYMCRKAAVHILLHLSSAAVWLRSLVPVSARRCALAGPPCWVCACNDTRVRAHASHPCFFWGGLLHLKVHYAATKVRRSDF